MLNFIMNHVYIFGFIFMWIFSNVYFENAKKEGTFRNWVREFPSNAHYEGIGLLAWVFFKIFSPLVVIIDLITSFAMMIENLHNALENLTVGLIRITSKIGRN